MNTNLGAMGTYAILVLLAVSTGGEALANMQQRLRGALELPFLAQSCARSVGVHGPASACAVEGLRLASGAWAEGGESSGAPRGDHDLTNGTMDGGDGLAFAASPLEIGDVRHGVTMMLLAGADTHDPRLPAAAQAGATPDDAVPQPALAGDALEQGDSAARSQQSVVGEPTNRQSVNRQAAAGPGKPQRSTMDSGLFALVAWLALLALGGVGVGSLSRLFDGRSSGLGDRHLG
jgi:hypothetical protein